MPTTIDNPTFSPVGGGGFDPNNMYSVAPGWDEVIDGYVDPFGTSHGTFSWGATYFLPSPSDSVSAVVTITGTFRAQQGVSGADGSVPTSNDFGGIYVYKSDFSYFASTTPFSIPLNDNDDTTQGFSLTTPPLTFTPGGSPEYIMYAQMGTNVNGGTPRNDVVSMFDVSVHIQYSDGGTGPDGWSFGPTWG